MSNAYTSLVATAKVAARDILRMRKISKWMSRKAELENGMTFNAKEHAEYVASREKAAAIAEYEATSCPVDHPGREDKLENAKKVRELVDQNIVDAEKRYAARKETDEKRMTEIETAITEWCDGVRKVDADELARLTDELLKANVSTQFSTTGEAVTPITKS